METSVSNSSNQTFKIIRNYLEQAYSNRFDYVLNDEFERLKQLTNEIRIFKTKSTYEGEKEINRKKNRYRDIVPYDDTRVVLNTTFTHDSDEDYINASFVRGALDDHYKYIAAQGPSKETIIDFIRMLVQFNIKIVICACNEYEGQKLKCFRYWTDNENLNLSKNYYISLKSKPIITDGLIIRELVVRSIKSSSNDSLKEYEFTQFHITNWPDHGVPNKLDSIMNTLKIVRHRLLSKENSKLSSEYIAVHCSAGCGRTGTIIAIDQVWTLLKQNKLNDEFSIFRIAYALREQRIAMIQTLSQYQLFAKAVVNLFEIELANQQKILNNSSSTSTTNNSKPFPVKSTHSNYDNLSNLAYQKSNQSSVIRSISPSDFKEDEDLFLKPVYTSPNARRQAVDSNNNNISNNETNSSNETKQQAVSKSPSITSRSAKSSESSFKSKTSRFTPNNLFNIFTQSQSKSNTKTSQAAASTSNFSMSASPAPSLLSDSKINYENITITSKKSDDSPSSNISSIYLSLNPKSNLTRSLMVTPSSKTYLTSKNIQIDSNNNTNSNYINTKQITSSNTNSTNTNSLASPSTQNLPNKQYNTKTTSPQIPRKLFNETNGDSLLNMSFSESIQNESINNNNLNSRPSTSTSINHQSELYLNDPSLNKKEPGSGCEFLSNKFEINRQNSTKSTIEHNSLTSNLASISTMSDSNLTPATYAGKSTKNYVLSTNQAKIGSVKHTDLRQTNPPLKAELYDSLPKVTLESTSIQLDDLEQPPKPPVRRTKKSSKSIDEEEDKSELKQVEAKKTANFSIKYDKNTKTNENTTTNGNNNNSKPYTTQFSVQQPNESGVIFRSSRSNSSTYYDNHNDSDDHSTSVRNAVIIDANLENELRNKQQEQKTTIKSNQQRFSKNSSKNSDSSISQTLPSRKSMTSLNNNYDQMNLNEQLVINSKKKELITNSTNHHMTNPHHHHNHQRTNHFSHHFNFPYRIQFTKANGVESAKSSTSSSANSSTAADDGKYFLYNTSRIKNDFIRNSENLSELNQLKRRSAHLFNL